MTVITGFLGAGKTTLLRKLLEKKGLGFTLGAIVNDFAEINIDADLVKNEYRDSRQQSPGTSSGTTPSRILELSNGCLCCDLAGDLRKAVWGILNVEGVVKSTEDALLTMGTTSHVDYLLVETSGVTDPTEVILTLEEAFGKMTRVRLESVVTVVDSERILAESESMDATHSSSRAEIVRRSQLACADIVIANKMDLLNGKSSDLDKVRDMLRRQATGAEIVLASYCDVSLPRVLAVEKVTAEREGSGRILRSRERSNHIEYVLPLAVRLRDPSIPREKRNALAVPTTGEEEDVSHHHNHHHKHDNPFGSVSFRTPRALSMKSFQQLVHTLRCNAAKNIKESTSSATTATPFFPSVVRMKGTVIFDRSEQYEFQLSGSAHRQRVQLLRMSTDYEDCFSFSVSSSSIVAIGPDLCTDKQRQQFLEHLQNLTRSSPPPDEDGGEWSTKFASRTTMWHRLIKEDESMELLRPLRAVKVRGEELHVDGGDDGDVVLFRIGAPKDIGFTAVGLETRYGIDFDAIVKEFVRRVNAANLPLLLRVTRARLPKATKHADGADTDGESAVVSCVALTVPVGVVAEADIRKVWSCVRACASEPIKRMKRRIPACRCGE